MSVRSSGIRFSALVLYVLLGLYSSTSSAQEKKNLRVVFTGLAWNSELPFRVALARGFFKGQGLEIQPIFVRGGPAALAALSSGEVDFAEIGGAQAIMRSRARGLDGVIIGAISNATNYQIVGSKSTRTLEDMKGKIVGVTGAGAFSDFAMRIFLRRKGIDPDKDVTLRAIGGSNLRAGALEKGTCGGGAVRAGRYGATHASRFSDARQLERHARHSTNNLDIESRFLGEKSGDE